MINSRSLKRPTWVLLSPRREERYSLFQLSRVIPHLLTQSGHKALQFFRKLGPSKRRANREAVLIHASFSHIRAARISLMIADWPPTAELVLTLNIVLRKTYCEMKPG
jgi:hypothetical protein